MDDAAESAVWKELARLARLDTPDAFHHSPPVPPSPRPPEIYFSVFLFVSVSSAKTGKGHCE